MNDTAEGEEDEEVYIFCGILEEQKFDLNVKYVLGV